MGNYKFTEYFYSIGYDIPPQSHRLLYDMMNPRIRWYPEKIDLLGYNGVNGIIEEELLQCERSAYAGLSSEVDPCYDYLRKNYPTKKWYRGEKTIFEVPAGIILLVGRESRVLQYLKLFLSSGIYNQVSDQFTKNETLGRETEAKLEKHEKFRHAATSFRVVSLGDSIQTIFILLVACLAACFCLAVIEYVKCNRANVEETVRLVCPLFIEAVQKYKRHKKMLREIDAGRMYNRCTTENYCKT